MVKEDKYKKDMNTKLLDNRSATKSISGAKTNNKPTTDFLEVSGIRKSNFKSISPPSIYKEIEAFIGNGSATILLRKT